MNLSKVMPSNALLGAKSAISKSSALKTASQLPAKLDSLASLKSMQEALDLVGYNNKISFIPYSKIEFPTPKTASEQILAYELGKI